MEDAIPFFDELPDSAPETVQLPDSALCLKVPGTSGEELVVHREGSDDYVFLFEALDDASDYSLMAEQALGFIPEIGRVQVAELAFRIARYKPAVGEQTDIALRHR